MTYIKNILVSGVVAAGCAFFVSHAHAAQAGPDGADHIMTDAVDPDPGGAGSLYDYVDISAGVPIVSGDDVVVQLNFPSSEAFWLYGTERSTFFVSTNGFISSENGGAFDVSSDCPLPAVPSTGAGDRIYALHDDLDSSVYYQYFPTGIANSWNGPLSVIQWVGTHFTGGAVDFELLLFHDLHIAIVMIETDGETGEFSTTGMQNSAGNIGMDINCQTPGAFVAGEGMYGFGTLRLNEIRIDEPGAGDPNEYFELSGVPGWDASALDLVVIGDGAGALGSGVIEENQTLNGGIFDPNGFGAVFMTMGTSAFNLAGLSVDYQVANDDLNFENSDNVTFFLVEGYTGSEGTDLDTNDDGNLDTQPWTRIIDNVALIEENNPPAGTEFFYGSIAVGPDGNNVPGHVQRCGDVHGNWAIATLDPAAGDDSPSFLNICQTCGNGIVEGTEACDGDGAGNGGETATCNADCSVSACGDGTVNATANEMCDDGNQTNEDDCPDGVGGTCVDSVCGDGFVDAQGAVTEGCDDGDGDNSDDCPDGAGGTCQPAVCGDSFVDMEGASQEECDDAAADTATCDSDCTNAVCGDDYVNTVAGETCDASAGARTAACDTDCTAASCGDGIVNTTAGEICDGDGAGTPGPTATCDTDCTMATCGDGVVNALAGEDCDDTAESLTCDGDCTSVVCGDGELNVTAGEGCDDGNTMAGDGCDATCMTEMGMGGMGGMGAGGGGRGGMGMGGMGVGVGVGGAATGGAGPGAGVGGNTSSTGSGNDDDDSSQAEGGCNCSAPGNGGSNGGAALALLLGLSVVTRRRRRTV